MSVFAITTAGKVEIIIAAVIAINLIVDWLVPSYGRDRGYPFAPLFISAFFLGFPLVLLAIVIGAGPQRFQAVARRGKSGPGRSGSEASRMLDDPGR